jgi:isoamylase
MTDEDWDREDTRALAVFLNGREIDEHDPEGRQIRGHSFLLLVNADHEPVACTLPTSSSEAGWTTELSTIALERTVEGVLSGGDALELPNRAMVILRRS